MDRASEPSIGASRAGALLLAGLVGAALAGATFAGDGSDIGGTLPVGGGTVILLAGASLAVALGRLPAPRSGRWGAVLLASTTALVAWMGASVAWSIVPDRSWDAFNKSVAYAAFLGLGLVLAAAGGRRAPRLAASVLSLVIGATLVWALLAKVVPALDPEGDRVARLREPVGYWNALALLADMALVLGLWLGTASGHRRSVRIAGGLLVYAAALSLLLTLSRAGVLVAVAVVALWFVLARERVEAGLLLAACAGPAVLIGAWAFTRPALTEDVATRSDRVADGALFGGLVMIGAVVVAALVGIGSRRALPQDARRRAGRRLALVAAVLVLASGAAFAVSTVDAISSGRSCKEVVNDPSRLRSLELNNRLCWWNEAWDVFVDHSPEGAGAGTFEIARKRYRSDARNVVQPHSVPLQQLADGGLVALGLFLVLVAAAGAVCVCALRRLAGPERAEAAALVALPAVRLGHAVVDYDWDFLAVTAPTMFALGVLAAAGRMPASARKRPLAAVAVVLFAAAVIVSLSSPRIADDMERRSTRALAARDFERAHDRALWARFFDPLGVDPMFALARVAERQRFRRTAEKRYIEAVEHQPQNPETWYTLGLYEFQVLGNLCATYRFLNNAYTLDPAGSQWVRRGPLDVAREAVDAGGCRPGS